MANNYHRGHRLCPKCNKRTSVVQTKYGVREFCCDLVGWNYKPMQDKKTRDRRMEFHKKFDPIWKTKGISRSQAYKRLAELMHLDVKQIHGSTMDYEILDFAIHAAEVMIKGFTSLK